MRFPYSDRLFQPCHEDRMPRSPFKHNGRHLLLKTAIFYYGFLLFSRSGQCLMAAHTEHRTDGRSSWPKVAKEPAPCLHGSIQRKAWGAREATKKLISAPVFALLRLQRIYTIDTGNFDRQVAFVLLPRQNNGQVNTIGYWSRSLTISERGYDTINRECIAIIPLVLSLRSYLESTQFLIWKDHEASKWILNLGHSRGKIAQ